MLNPLSNNTSKEPLPVFLNRDGSNSCCGAASVSGAGVEDFIELSDTPNSYMGQAGKAVTVKSDESGLEFTTSGWRPARRVARDDAKWTDDHTYTDTDLAGTEFFVYYNGNKMLTPELEGFEILDTGGFTYDPSKFQFYDGEFLYIIF